MKPVLYTLLTVLIFCLCPLAAMAATGAIAHVARLNSIAPKNHRFADLQQASLALRAITLDGHERDHGDERPTKHPALGNFTDGVFYIDTLHPAQREKGFQGQGNANLSPPV